MERGATGHETDGRPRSLAAFMSLVCALLLAAGALTASVLNPARAYADAGIPVYSSPEELDGKRFGAITGSTQEGVIEANFPSAQIQYFDSFSDLATAVEADQIDVLRTRR